MAEVWSEPSSATATPLCRLQVRGMLRRGRKGENAVLTVLVKPNHLKVKLALVTVTFENITQHTLEHERDGSKHWHYAALMENVSR